MVVNFLSTSLQKTIVNVWLGKVWPRLKNVVMPLACSSPPNYFTAYSNAVTNMLVYILQRYSCLGISCTNPKIAEAMR